MECAHTLGLTGGVRGEDIQVGKVRKPGSLGHSFCDLRGSDVTNGVGVCSLVETGRPVHDLSGMERKNTCHNDPGGRQEAGHSKGS